MGHSGAPAPPPVPSHLPWLRSEDGPLLQTETKPLRTCPTCNIPLPVDATSCPRCGRFTPGHKDARKRLKKSDVDALIAKAKIDHEPVTETEHHLCANLGLTLAELQTTRAGSQDHTRLLGAIQTISGILDTSRSSRPSAGAHVPNDLATASTDDLIDRLSSSLRALLELRDLEARAQDFARQPWDPSGTDGGPDPGAVPPVARDPGDAGFSVATRSTSALAQETVCAYCHRMCVGRGHPSFDVLHWGDPDEVLRRDEEATVAMLRMVGEPLPDWYRS